MFGAAYALAGAAAPIAGIWLLIHAGSAALWLTCGAVCAAVACGQLLPGRAVRARRPSALPALRPRDGSGC